MSYILRNKSVFKPILIIFFSSFLIFYKLPAAHAASLVVYNGYNTSIFAKSDPGDYIGRGLSHAANENITATPIYSNYAKGIRIRWDSPTEFNYLSFEFAAPFTETGGVRTYHRIEPGIYLNATRLAFRDVGEPGLSVVSTGRGCNRLGGQFTVLEANYSEDGNTLLSFAADFVQHCEGHPEKFRGAVRYKANDPAGSLNLIGQHIQTLETGCDSEGLANQCLQCGGVWVGDSWGLDNACGTNDLGVAACYNFHRVGCALASS